MANSDYDEMHDKFSDWNPMKEDYLNSDFNLYDSGPGAFLDTALQPAELAKQQQVSKISKQNEKNSNGIVTPYLVFKNLPRGMTDKSIANLCLRYGNVKRCTASEKTQSIFVDLYSVADMEAIYRKLENNQFGFNVFIGRKMFNQKKNETGPKSSDNFSDFSARSAHSSYINKNERAIYISGKKPPRPRVNQNENDCGNKVADEENSALTSNDPLCHYLNEGDAHALEREGISQPITLSQPGNDYQYRTGRAYIKMPEKTKDYLKEKHTNSKGKYNSKTGVYCNKVESMSQRELHKCIVCNIPADVVCLRCSPKLYTYCSRQCQNVDWNEHRKVCGKNEPDFKDLSQHKSPSSHSNSSVHEEVIRPASSLSSSSSATTQTAFPKPEMPSSNSIVTLTAIGKTNLVFIRPKSEEKNVKFFEIISKIQAAAKILRPLKKLPVCGKAVIAKFRDSAEYGRALVLNASSADNIKINFLDYGNIETQELSNLYKAPAELVAMPRFAIPVVLKNVSNHYMVDEVRNFMYSYLNDIDLIVKFDPLDDLLPVTNVFQVDLYDASSNQHLNKIISTLCKPKEPANSYEIVSFEDLKVMPIPVGNDVKLFVMDNSQLEIGCISCTTCAFGLEIAKFGDDIQRYASSLKSPSRYAPRVNELCIAKYDVDGLWYRGRCLEKVGDGKPTIHFIDYGNIAYVKVEDIRPYPPKFSWPKYTAEFAIEGLPEEIDSEMATKLEELYQPGQPIHCDFIEKVDDHFYNLRMNKTITILKDEGLFK